MIRYQALSHKYVCSLTIGGHRSNRQLSLKQGDAGVMIETLATGISNKSFWQVCYVQLQEDTQE